MDTVTCGKCGGQNRAGAKFCTHCGAALSAAPPVDTARAAPAADPDPFAAWPESWKTPAPPAPASPAPPTPNAWNAPAAPYNAPANPYMVTPPPPPGAPVPGNPAAWSPAPAPPGGYPAQALPGRPGCVTFYAVMLIIGAVFVGLGAFAMGDPLLTLLFLAQAVASVVIAIGLFQQKNWARVGVIVLMSLSIAAQLILAVLALSGSGDVATALGGLVGIPIGIFILHWFYKNKAPFR